MNYQDFIGHRIRCDYMYDIIDGTGKQDIQATKMNGVCGIVESVDGIGQLHVNWDNHSSLALNPQVDKFTFLD